MSEVAKEQSWMDAYLALKARIEADEQFPALVRGYGGDPNAVVPSRRCARVAARICERLDLDPAVYLGNVFGAAADRIRERTASL